jgi:hypothetical protein
MLNLSFVSLSDVPVLGVLMRSLGHGAAGISNALTPSNQFVGVPRALVSPGVPADGLGRECPNCGNRWLLTIPTG